MMTIRSWTAMIAALLALNITVPSNLSAKQSPVLPVAVPDLGDGGMPDFYRLTAPPPKRPGVLIRSEAMQPAQSLAKAASNIRFLYSSTDGLDGKTAIAVSGAIFIPSGTSPKGGWPLIAWAHGTVGIADICAPSFNVRSARDTAYLNHWLAQGYAIVASDYQGLGVNGGHPYLATRPAAYSVLDGIRAAQKARLKLSKKVVVVGQSQGGGAAFGIAGYAPSYAPELDISGTVATGTPYFTPKRPPMVSNSNVVSPAFGLTLLAMYLRVQVDPTFRPEDNMTLEGLRIFQMGRTGCFDAMAKAVVEKHITRANAFHVEPLQLLADQYVLMSYATLKLKGPVFMGTGSKDEAALPAAQLRLRNDACAAGSVIEHHVYPNLDHQGTVNGSLEDSTPFVKKAFAGETIAGNCNI
jgi:pimeloyl-ACP methyl ester carboxylesterase